MVRRVSNEKIKIVLNRASKGAKPKDISKAYNINYAAVLRILKGEIKPSYEAEKKPEYTKDTLKRKTQEFKQVYLDWFNTWENKKELPEIDLLYEQVVHSKGIIYAVVSQESLQDSNLQNITEKHETLLKDCLEKICKESDGPLEISFKDFSVVYENGKCAIKPKTLQNYEARAFLFGLYKEILERKIKPQQSDPLQDQH